MLTIRSFVLVASSVTFVTTLAPPPAAAFSQLVASALPLGHETLTVLGAALAKVPGGGAPAVSRRAQAIGMTVTTGVCALSYGAKDYRTCSAVLGNRWVDNMGFPSLSTLATPSKDPRTGFNCLMAVAQDQDAVMYEHFLRKEADVSTAKVDGRKNAIEGSIRTLRKLIVEAIAAPDVAIDASDGGALHVDSTVSLRYFLLGRALHLVQDSFSY